MSYADRIRSAPDLPSAIVILAEGIDAVLAQPAEKATADPWSTATWPRVGNAPELAIDPERIQLVARDETREQTRQRAIEATQEALNTATDPDDRRALEARLRLLTDDGASIDVGAPAGNMAVEQEVGDQVVMTLPTPSPSRQNARAGFAGKNELWNFSTLDEEEFTDAFMKGGPLWLYHTARDEVMAMPYEWRQWLIADINLDSPRTAQEVGRDILKDEGTGNKAVALGTLGVDDE